MRTGAVRDKDNTDLRRSSSPCRKGTRSVKGIHGLAVRVEVGAPDAWLTPASGVVTVAELVGWLGVIDALDDAVRVIKQRDRGLSARQFLVALAQAQMLGTEFLAGLDHVATMRPGRRCRRWRRRPRARRRRAVLSSRAGRWAPEVVCK